ncbi:MAG: hypothetical protein KA198_08830 [Chitinophagaceae bacterium]|nr:hypothetical protein [Chitinophagaceae bacterium]
MQNQVVPLKKVSITSEQVSLVIEMSSKKMSGRKIAILLSIPQPTLWRNMQILGLTKKKKERNNDIFNWEDFDNSII